MIRTYVSRREACKTSSFPTICCSTFPIHSVSYRHAHRRAIGVISLLHFFSRPFGPLRYPVCFFTLFPSLFCTFIYPAILYTINCCKNKIQRSRSREHTRFRVEKRIHMKACSCTLSSMRNLPLQIDATITSMVDR